MTYVLIEYFGSLGETFRKKPIHSEMLSPIKKDKLEFNQSINRAKDKICLMVPLYVSVCASFFGN